jgi:ankyrin repeat protein
MSESNSGPVSATCNKNNQTHIIEELFKNKKNNQKSSSTTAIKLNLDPNKILISHSCKSCSNSGRSSSAIISQLLNLKSLNLKKSFDQNSKLDQEKSIMNAKKTSKRHSKKYTVSHFGSEIRELEENYEYSDLNEAKAKQKQQTLPIDYEKLLPDHKCGNLTKLNYVNSSEKYLITRIYSNINKLSTILAELYSNKIGLDYYLKTPDQNDCLPLYYAIKADCPSTVKLLVNYGAGLERTTRNGDPAKHLSSLLGSSIELVEYLISFGDQNDLYETDQEGWTILHCSANQGHLHLVKYFIEIRHMNPNVKDSKTSFTPLQLAILNNHLNVVDYFLSFQPLSSLLKRSSLNIEKKASLKKYSDENDGNLDLAKKHQPKINSNNQNKKSNNNALIKSCLSFAKGSLQESSTLFENSSMTLNSKTKSSKISFDLDKNENSSKKNTQKKIVSKSASFAKKTTETKSKIVTLVPAPVQQPEKIIPLSNTFQKTQIEPSIDYLRDLKQNPLNKIDVPSAVYNNFIIDLNSKNYEGQTALHLACIHGRYEIANILLKKYGSHQLDVNLKDFKQRTCLDLAWFWLLNLNLEYNVQSNPNEGDTLFFWLELF